MSSHARATRQASTGRLAPVGLALVALMGSGSAALAQQVVAASPDVTIQLGAANIVTSDHAVAADNQLGIVALQNLGAIPDSADVTGYDLAPQKWTS